MTATVPDAFSASARASCAVLDASCSADTCSKCGGSPSWRTDRGGVSVGATDELGSAAVQDRFHVKHLHATMLQQLGIDPDRLTYFYGGLDQKLVGVEGAEPIREVMA